MGLSKGFLSVVPANFLMITPPIMGHSLHSFWSSFALWCRFDVGLMSAAVVTRDRFAPAFLYPIYSTWSCCATTSEWILIQKYSIKKKLNTSHNWKGWERNKFPDYFSQSFRQIIFHKHSRFQSLYPGLSSLAQCTFMPPSLSHRSAFTAEPKPRTGPRDPAKNIGHTAYYTAMRCYKSEEFYSYKYRLVFNFTSF